MSKFEDLSTGVIQLHRPGLWRFSPKLRAGIRPFSTNEPPLTKLDGRVYPGVRYERYMPELVVSFLHYTDRDVSYPLGASQ